MVDPREVFPGRLEQRLQMAGLLDVEVAEVLDVPLAAVESWLDGSGFPCPRTFGRLLILLGISRDELLT